MMLHNWIPMEEYTNPCLKFLKYTVIEIQKSFNSRSQGRGSRSHTGLTMIKSTKLFFQLFYKSNAQFTSSSMFCYHATPESRNFSSILCLGCWCASRGGGLFNKLNGKFFKSCSCSFSQETCALPHPSAPFESNLKHISLPKPSHPKFKQSGVSVVTTLVW